MGNIPSITKVIALTSVADNSSGERFNVKTPDQKLLLAVVERALKDLIWLTSTQRENPQSQVILFRYAQQRAETLEFFLEKTDRESPRQLSLPWILEHIAFDPEAERNRLEKIAYLIIGRKININFLKTKALPKCLDER